MLTSSRKNEVSYTTEDGPGVFSKYLTKGLKGPADRDNDGKITARELYRYTSRRVSNWSLETGKTQNPQMVPKSGGDVTLSRPEH